MSIIRVIKKYRLLFTEHQRFRVFELIILMLIGGALETCSVGLIVPFMNAIVNIDTIMDLWYVQKVCKIMHLSHPYTFLFIVSTSLGLLFILKNLYLIFEYNTQYRFSYNNMFHTQKKILQTYLNKPYEYYLNSNSGEFIRLINSDVPATYNTLIQLLGLCTELIVSIMLIITIMVMIPMVSIAIALLLMILLLLINRIIRPILQKEGLNSQIASANMNKWLLQSINGIKEIKVMNSEDFFLNNFVCYGQSYAKSVRNNSILGMVPRFVIEATCMASLFFVIAFLIVTGSRFDEIMPILSAVAMAAVRLLPSVNRISTATAVVAYNEPMLDKVISSVDPFTTTNIDSQNSEKNDIRNSNVKLLPISERITMSNVTFHYPNSDVNVLEKASIEIRKGESVGIIGGSGEGKTTAVDIVLGLITPQEGSVMADGRDVTRDLKSWHAQLGYIPQSIFMLDGTIRDNVVFGRENENDDKVWQALEDAALSDFVHSIPQNLEAEVGERGIRISGGQKQRIGIARALYSSPEILIFDEATSALDNNTEAEVMNAVNGLHGKKTLIIIAHRLTTIEGCDHVYEIKDGKIIKVR